MISAPEGFIRKKLDGVSDCASSELLYFAAQFILYKIYSANNKMCGTSLTITPSSNTS